MRETKEQSEQQFESIKMEITPFRDFAARLENENGERVKAAEEEKEVDEPAESESIRESI